MKRWILGLVIAGGLSLLTTASASAQGYGGFGYAGGAPGVGIGYTGGYGGAGISAGFGGYDGGSRISGYGGYPPAHGYGCRLPVWHDTTHYDYHPPTVRRHGNHFHVQPGHYHLHRSGHYHH